jgi:ribosomal protein L11 methyltransferase
LATHSAVTSNNETSEWLEISIDIHPDAHESVSAFLFDLGCSGVVSEDFQHGPLKSYLTFPENLDGIRNRISVFLESLKKNFPEIPYPEIRLTKIEDQDWSVTWRRFFHADRVTSKLMVLPPWEPVPDIADSHVIRIEPGLAFGTGQHPTTRMCLEAMGRIPEAGLRAMLDVGTGSGILSIYGAKLGANKILAIDKDPEATVWAERNIELNSLSGTIELSATPLEQVTGNFSVLTANLILSEIVKMLPHFHRLLEPEGYLIVSGILIDQVEKANSVLQEYRFGDLETLFKNEWVCIISRKGNET